MSEVEVKEIVEMVRGAVRLELDAAPIAPEFAGAGYLRSRFGLNRGTLLKLAENGLVRRKKIGDAMKGQSLYRVADVAEWMLSEKGVEG